MKKNFVLIAIFSFSLIGNLFALTVSEIIDKANNASYYKGDSGKAAVKMTIIDSQNRERNREFTILRLNGKDGSQKFYVYFNRPSDVRKMAFLVHKYLDKDDDRWLYLPALDLVKRISAGDKRTSFVGSDFYYEDVSGRNPSADNHNLVETTNDYFVIKSVPKDEKSVEFAYYKTWIHKTTFLPIKTEYYNAKGEVFRKYEANKVETINNFPTVVKATMNNLESASKTIIEYSNVAYNLGFKEDVFSERYLKNPPREYLG